MFHNWFWNIWSKFQYHKGFDLLIDALKHLRQSNKNLELAIFGQCAPKEA